MQVFLLRRTRHAIVVKAFDINHGLRDVVFLFSFFEEPSLIDDTHLDELVDIFRRELLFGK
jgi:hypothetical protein